MNKNYYAIIPANVRYDKELRANAKLLYGEITALCNEKGYCWANNHYFAELYGVEKETISRWIGQLEKKGYIDTEIKYKGNTREVQERRIYISVVSSKGIDKKINNPMTKKSRGIDEKVKGYCPNSQEGIDEKVNNPMTKKSRIILQDNNTFNTTTNTTVKKDVDGGCVEDYEKTKK